MWHGQVMTPLVMPVTAQPWWVHFDENALNSPAVGWVTTTPESLKILPPPSGMSEVFPRTLPPHGQRPTTRRSRPRTRMRSG